MPRVIYYINQNLEGCIALVRDGETAEVAEKRLSVRESRGIVELDLGSEAEAFNEFASKPNVENALNTALNQIVRASMHAERIKGFMTYPQLEKLITSFTGREYVVVSAISE